MKTVITAVVAALGILAQPALAAGPTKAPPSGKRQAPVQITAQLVAGTARVEVIFQSASSGVEVRVAGLDGLKVISASRPVRGVEFQSGQRIVVDVAFTAPASESNLAVTVSGKFAGTRGSKTATFTVDGTSATQPQKAVTHQQTDSHGERIRIVPAEPAKN